MKTCSFHIQSSERALSKIRQSNSIDFPEVHELEKLLSADMMEYDSYSKRMNLAKILRDEIRL
jgi:Zn-dependent membrane protease YugP